MHVGGEDGEHPVTVDGLVRLQRGPGMVGLEGELGDLRGLGCHVDLQREREAEGQNGVPAVGEQLLGLLQAVADHLGDDAEQDILLALEPVVQAPVEDPGLGHDIPGGRGLVALGVEQLQSCRQDDAAGFLALLLRRGLGPSGCHEDTNGALVFNFERVQNNFDYAPLSCIHYTLFSGYSVVK